MGVTATSSSGLAEGVRLVNELIRTITDEYYASSSSSHSKDKGKKGKGKGKGKDGKGKKGKARQETSEEGVQYTQTVPTFEVDPETGYQVKGAIIGKGGENTKHIASQTGTKIKVLGENFEIVEIEIIGDTEEAVSEAAAMAEELVNTTYAEYEEFAAKHAAGEVSAKGKGKDKDKHQGELYQAVELPEYDPAFVARQKVLGPKGTNVHHIQDQSNTQVKLGGNESDPTCLEVYAHTEKDLEYGVQLAQELVDAVNAEYDEWLNSGDHHAESWEREEKGKGKKGKGKEKGKEQKGKDEKGGKGKDKDRHQGELYQAVEL